ncbi:hypothetical protein P691DRAFT_764150 [Macrolepiota fuliginosa MF-IS2]|uniref:Uncharacterized protein n=1 Tax=Macrolepiota fuliginosa MF-IS2 TaxID=1400762 RepID=A0A9P5X564_9AGAR|nr:hypothetical protein P691DRAFT_764150 [Macrolepiota fuliginosa MF-IS2]
MTPSKDLLKTLCTRRFSKVFLVCLILYGIRRFHTFPRLLQALVKPAAIHPAIKNRVRAVTRLLEQIIGRPTNTVSSPPSYIAKDNAPCIWNCSSLPNHLHSPGCNTQIVPELPLTDSPTPLDDDATPNPAATHGSSTQNNEDQRGPSPTPPQSPPELFKLHPPEPFLEVCPITAAQLVPRRWPIPRKELPDLPNLYTHNMMIPEKADEGYIPPYTMDYTPDVTIPGWTTYLHPQGPLYYYNEEKNVVTNTNIFDDENLRVITNMIVQIYRKVEDDGLEIPSDSQLVIDIRWDRLKIGYYFATLQGRCLFWTEEKCVRPLYKRVERVWSHSHIGHVVEAEFWLHYQCFPHVQALPPQLVREIKGFLLFTATDQIFNAKTTSEYSSDEVDKALSIINSIPLDFIGPERNAEPEAGYHLWIAGCIMSLNALHRFDNHHGQPNARWLRDDFLFEDSEERSRTYFMIFLSPVLFYTPETYYHSLRNIMNDGNVFFEAWRNFVVELHQEWSGLIIIATVLLATNMAFLAIPSLDSGDDPESRSPAQICSYLSIILSVSSIVLGQLFSRYHRIKGWEHFDERITDNFNFLLDVGCSHLAIMYSLPYALLSWSLIGFLAAFLVMCFRGTQNDVRLIVGIPSSTITVIMLYCLYKMRYNDEQRSALPFLVKYYRIFRYRYEHYRSQRRKDEEGSESVELDAIPYSTSPLPQSSNV